MRSCVPATLLVFRNGKANVFLGIDLGTGSVKLMLVDADGGEHVAVRSYPVESQAPGLAETDPEAWIEAIRLAVCTLPPLGGLRAVGLSGQMHGIVPLGRDSLAPLHHAILWADRRGAPYLDRFTHLPRDMGERIINAPAAGLAATTLLWLKDERPDDYRRIGTVLFPKDWVRAVLTGAVMTDFSDASGSLLYDFEKREWYADLLSELGLARGLLPEIRQAVDCAGRITAEAARRTGLPEGVPVAVGAGDAPAGMYGSGVESPFEVQLSVGTAAQISRPIPSDRLPERAPSLNVFEGVLASQRYRVAAMLNAGLALEWVRGLFHADWEELYKRGATGAPDLTFLPYLTGERTPYMNPDARGAWVGLSLHHAADDLLLAALLGVACSIRLGLDTLGTAGVERVVAVGGSLRYPFWRKLLATVIERPLTVLNQKDMSARGAARLAATMAHETMARAGGGTVTQHPEPAPWVEGYYRAFIEQYRRLFPG